MPEIVDELPKARRRGKASKWPWDELLDGQVWFISNEELGSTKASGFVSGAYAAASAREMSVACRIAPDGVYLQGSKAGNGSKAPDTAPLQS